MGKLCQNKVEVENTVTNDPETETENTNDVIDEATVDYPNNGDTTRQRVLSVVADDIAIEDLENASTNST